MLGLRREAPGSVRRQKEGVENSERLCYCSGGNIRCWLGSEIQMLGFVVGGFVILSYIYIYIHMHINM